MFTVFVQSKWVGFIFQASSTHSTQVISIGWRERNKELGNQQQQSKAWIQSEWVELKYQALLEIVSLPPYVCFYHDCFMTVFLQAKSSSRSKWNRVCVQCILELWAGWCFQSPLMQCSTDSGMCWLPSLCSEAPDMAKAPLTWRAAA